MSHVVTYKRHSELRINNIKLQPRHTLRFMKTAILLGLFVFLSFTSLSQQEGGPIIAPNCVQTTELYCAETVGALTDIIIPPATTEVE